MISSDGANCGSPTASSHKTSTRCFKLPCSHLDASFVASGWLQGVLNLSSDKRKKRYVWNAIPKITYPQLNKLQKRIDKKRELLIVPQKLYSEVKMRKALILFIFVTLSIGIFAKAGIYGLDFNQSLEEADKKLSNNSFTQFKKNGLAAVYKRTKPSTAMVEIDLDSDTGKVIRWYATYDLNDDANVRDSIFSMVKGIHGTYDFWDDIEDVYVWDNYDGTAIYIFPAGDNNLVVEYSEWDEYYDDWEDYFW